MTTVFLDANVFLYAIGEASPFRSACRALLEATANGTLSATTSSEVLQEVLHVRSRRTSAASAVEAVRAAASLVPEVLPVTREDVLLACDFLERHHHVGLRGRDAVHVAVMRNRSLETLVSADADFDVLDVIKRVDPIEAVKLVR